MIDKVMSADARELIRIMIKKLESSHPYEKVGPGIKRVAAAAIATLALTGCFGSQAVNAAPESSTTTSSTEAQPTNTPSSIESSPTATNTPETIDYNEGLTAEQFANMSPEELEKYSTLSPELINNPEELLRQYYLKTDSFVEAGTTDGELEEFWRQAYANGEALFSVYWSSTYGEYASRIDSTIPEAIDKCVKDRYCFGIAGSIFLQQTILNSNNFYGTDIPPLKIKNRKFEIVSTSAIGSDTIVIKYLVSAENDADKADLERALQYLPAGSEFTLYDGVPIEVISTFTLNSSTSSLQQVSIERSTSQAG